MSTALPKGVAALLPAFLGRQRWYAGPAPEPGKVGVVDSELLVTQEAGRRRPWWAVLEAGGGRWQVLLGERQNGDPAEFLHGHDVAMLGGVGSAYFYEGTLDPALDLALLELVTASAESAERVRPVGTEQSNTSLVYDDRLILKVFRRLVDGPQPDVEVTSGLVGAGFDHVPRPLATWQRGGVDLAVAQEFLVGGVEGWALALTSLRDLYGSHLLAPAEAGGDFAAEASRLGEMTAELHLCLARAFGESRQSGQAKGWADLMAVSLEDMQDEDSRLGAQAGLVIDSLRQVHDSGPAIRVHGDYHLGQVLRTDTGWFVLDFEGEPARSREDRTRPTSPLKDVAGMLRSLNYAARVALRDYSEDPVAEAALERLAGAWEARNRQAFLDGYLGYRGIDELLPGDKLSRSTVMRAFELDKALYEMAYERSYRPDWVAIPRGAILGMLGVA